MIIYYCKTLKNGQLPPNQWNRTYYMEKRV